MWYGLKIGLDYNQANDIPFGELLDLITIEQIKHEGLPQKEELDDEDIIPNVR